MTVSNDKSAAFEVASAGLRAGLAMTASCFLCLCSYTFFDASNQYWGQKSVWAVRAVVVKAL